MSTDLTTMLEIVTDAVVAAVLINLTTSRAVAVSEPFADLLGKEPHQLIGVPVEHLSKGSVSNTRALQMLRDGELAGYELDRYFAETDTTMRTWVRSLPPSHLLAVMTAVEDVNSDIEHLTVLPLTPTLRMIMHGRPITRARRASNVDRIAAKLTKREAEVFALIIHGSSVPAAAQELFLTPSTVRNHLSSIYRKTGVRSQTQLLRMVGQRRMEDQ